MTTDELRAARQKWAAAHLNLDKIVAAVLAAADAGGGQELQQLLTPELAHEISGLYGTVVGAWVHYRELLRLTHESERPGGSC